MEIAEREQLKHDLTEADANIRTAAARIDGRRAAIAERERNGQDVSRDREVLNLLEATLELMRRHRAIPEDDRERT
jgi:hypothetical protein